MRSPVTDQLHSDIQACGYFPELVAEAVEMAVGDEEIRDFIVHHEPTFAHDEIRRHLTILVLTGRRLIVGHTDEVGEDPSLPSQAATSTESIPLGRIGAVALTRVVTNPEGHQHGRSAVVETWLSIGWGTARRLDLEPASCADPECVADHGYSGVLVADDLTVRMSVAADGEAAVARLTSFATALQQVAGGR